MSHAVSTEWIALPEDDGQPEVRLYVSRPETGPCPTVLVIHEAFGLDDHIQDVTRRFAAAGYLAVAPDLFWIDPFGRTVAPEEIKNLFALRMALPPERRRDAAALEDAIDLLPERERDRVREVAAWSAQRNPETFLPPLNRALMWARAHRESTGKVGVTGFCFGGGMVLHLAFSGAALDAAAPFYGSNPPLEQASQVRCPLLLVYGRNDPFIMPEVSALLGAVQEAGLQYGVRIYEDAGHAFLNDARPDVYNASAAHDAWEQMMAFFGKHLS